MDDGLLLGVVEQCKRSVANEIDSRFVTSDIQQHHECHQLFGGHLFARFFGCDQGREHVVTEVLAAVFDNGAARHGLREANAARAGEGQTSPLRQDGDQQLFGRRVQL